MHGEASQFRPRRRDFLAFSRPNIDERDIEEVVACLRSGWITSGPRVLQFERMFCDRLGVPDAVAVNSATAGLHLVLHAMGIGPGDEVVVPSLTWVSTANMVEMLGARAVLADIDPATLQLDPADVRRRLTARTRAVIPVHFAGAPVDLDAIQEAIQGAIGGRDVAIVEDAAHALGTSYRGREIGSQSRAAVFSFHPTKNITTGEGGMIVCGDSGLAARVRSLRSHGISRDAWSRHDGGSSPRYEVTEPGYKYNLTDMQAALGLGQFARLDAIIAQRRHLAERYDHLLAGLAGVRPIARPAYDFTHAWHLYVVRLSLDQLSLDRDGVMAALARENIGTGLHFVALHEQAYYRARLASEDALPHASAASEAIMSLPLYPGLSEADQDDVVEALRRVLKSCRIRVLEEQE
jgi:UDP-4-amino-4-deoxy-L-arabinose-oxoglutarate aminotransferase